MISRPIFQLAGSSLTFSIIFLSNIKKPDVMSLIGVSKEPKNLATVWINFLYQIHLDVPPSATRRLPTINSAFPLCITLNISGIASGGWLRSASITQTALESAMPIPSKIADPRPLFPYRFITWIGYVLARSCAASAVPSGELSSTNIISASILFLRVLLNTRSVRAFILAFSL
jgi:hypothetical protein